MKRRIAYAAGVEYRPRPRGTVHRASEGEGSGGAEEEVVVRERKEKRSGRWSGKRGGVGLLGGRKRRMGKKYGEVWSRRPERWVDEAERGGAADRSERRHVAWKVWQPTGSLDLDCLEDALAQGLSKSHPAYGVVSYRKSGGLGKDSAQRWFGHCWQGKAADRARADLRQLRGKGRSMDAWVWPHGPIADTYSDRGRREPGTCRLVAHGEVWLVRWQVGERKEVLKLRGCLRESRREGWCCSRRRTLTWWLRPNI